VRAAKFGLSALAVTLAYVAYRVQLDNLGGATTSGRALAIVTIGVAFVIAGTIAWSKRYPNRIAPLRTIRSRT